MGFLERSLRWVARAAFLITFFCFEILTSAPVFPRLPLAFHLALTIFLTLAGLLAYSFHVLALGVVARLKDGVEIICSFLCGYC